MGNAVRDFFAENGYYLARGVYSPREIGLLREEFDRIVHQVTEASEPGTGPNAKEDNGIISTFNVQKYSAYWLTHGLLHKPFLDLAEQFIGPDIVLQRTSLYEKRKADVVGPFRMHQDWIYGPMEKDTMVAGMIHVARVTAPMGALRIYPGSHRARIENARTSDEDFNRRFPLEGALVIEGEPGDVLFFHYSLVHGSKSNQIDEPRKIVHVRMFSGRDRREKHSQPFENLVLRGWNSNANATNATSANP